jgi:hypothetical protein
MIKYISLLPCHVCNKAGVTVNIFFDLLKGCDTEMGSAGRKDVLFVDECCAHPAKVVFVPVNCISML